MTPKQSACLDYVKGYIAANGFSPTYEEIKTALGLASKSGVNRLLNQLADHGKVRFGHQRARSIEIVKPGDPPPPPRPTAVEPARRGPDLAPVFGAAQHVVKQWRDGCLSRSDMERLEAAVKRARAS